MFGWFRELLEIRYEFKERKAQLNAATSVCQTCESLKFELERTSREKEQLLNRILELSKPVAPVEVRLPEPTTVQPIQLGKRHIPFAVRREMLEAEDREQARLLKEHQENLAKIRQEHLKPAPVSTAKVSPSVSDLEKELGVNQEDSGDANAVSSR